MKSFDTKFDIQGLLAILVVLLTVYGCERQNVRVNLEDPETIRSVRAAESIINTMKVIHRQDPVAFFADPKSALDQSINRLNQANREIPTNGWEILQDVKSYHSRQAVLKRILPESGKQVIATWEPSVRIFQFDEPILLGATL